jgi:hypothetical protein
MFHDAPVTEGGIASIIKWQTEFRQGNHDIAQPASQNFFH